MCNYVLRLKVFGKIDIILSSYYLNCGFYCNCVYLDKYVFWNFVCFFYIIIILLYYYDDDMIIFRYIDMYISWVFYDFFECYRYMFLNIYVYKKG